MKLACRVICTMTPSPIPSVQRVPWWEMWSSPAGPLLKHGFQFDQSHGSCDFLAFPARVGNMFNTIGLSKTATQRMHLLKLGKESDLVKIAAT